MLKYIRKACLLAAIACSSTLGPGARVQLTRLRPDASSFTYFSQLTQPERRVIRDDAAWESAWLSIGTSMPRPNVDFTKEMVLLAAFGTKPSSGYAVRFDSAATTNDGLIVWVATISPGPHCGTAAVITQPVDLARVARSSGDVQFVDVPTTSDCQ